MRKSSSRLWIFEISLKTDEYELNYRWYSWARYYRAHANQLDLLGCFKTINCRTNQGISERSKTLADKYLTRQIRFFFDYFCSDPVFTWFKKWEVKNEFYKIVKEDLDSPCRDPFGFFRQLISCRLILDVQSSCVLTYISQPPTTSTDLFVVLLSFIGIYLTKIQDWLPHSQYFRSCNKVGGPAQ